jgi:hypothetical protein
MDIERFDTQLIDFVAGFLCMSRTTRSVGTCFYWASVKVMDEPSAIEWKQADDERYQGVHLTVALAHLLERIPSENLRLVVDTFHASPDLGDADFREQLKVTLDKLWERHNVEPKPRITSFDETQDTLEQYFVHYTYGGQPQAKEKLLSLGNHLVPYVICGIEYGDSSVGYALFDLLKRLDSPVARKRLIAYANTTSNDQIGYQHRYIARQTLEELGIPY